MLRGYSRSDVHRGLLCFLRVLYHRIAWLRRVQRAGHMPVLVDTPGGQGVESLHTLIGVRELGDRLLHGWLLIRRWVCRLPCRECLCLHLGACLCHQ